MSTTRLDGVTMIEEPGLPPIEHYTKACELLNSFEPEMQGDKIEAAKAHLLAAYVKLQFYRTRPPRPSMDEGPPGWS